MGWRIDGRTHGGPSEIWHQCACACISVYVLVAVGQSKEIRFSNRRWNLCNFVCVAIPSNRAGTLLALKIILNVPACKMCQMWVFTRLVTPIKSDKLTFKYFTVLPIYVSYYKTNAFGIQKGCHQRHLQALFNPGVLCIPKSKMTAERCCQVCRQGFRWIELSAALR